MQEDNDTSLLESDAYSNHRKNAENSVGSNKKFLGLESDEDFMVPYHSQKKDTGNKIKSDECICSKIPNLTLDDIKKFQLILEHVKPMNSEDLKDHEDNRTIGFSKNTVVPIVDGSKSKLSEWKLDVYKRSYCKNPKEMVRRLLYDLVGKEVLEKSSVTGKNNRKPIDPDIFEDVESFVTINTETAFKLTHDEYRSCVTSLCATLRNNDSNTKKKMTRVKRSNRRIIYDSDSEDDCPKVINEKNQTIKVKQSHEKQLQNEQQECEVENRKREEQTSAEEEQCGMEKEKLRVAAERCQLAREMLAEKKAREDENENKRMAEEKSKHDELKRTEQKEREIEEKRLHLAEEARMREEQKRTEQKNRELDIVKENQLEKDNKRRDNEARQVINDQEFDVGSSSEGAIMETIVDTLIASPTKRVSHRERKKRVWSSVWQLQVKKSKKT